MPTDTWNSDRRSSRAQRQVRRWPRRRTAGSAADHCVQRRRARVPAGAAAASLARDQLQRLRDVEAARRCAGAPGVPGRQRGVGGHQPARVGRSATGSIAGARSPRGNSLPDGVHHRQGRRARREGEDASTGACARASRDSAAHHVGRAVVDQRVHRDHVVEARRAPGRACRRLRKSHASPCPASAGRRSRASATSVGDRSIATTSRAAARGFDGQRAGAAAGVEQAPAAQVGRQPATAACARMRSRPARTVARMRPTGASEVSRAQASAAVRSK